MTAKFKCCECGALLYSGDSVFFIKRFDDKDDTRIPFCSYKCANQYMHKKITILQRQIEKFAAQVPEKIIIE